MPKTKSQPNKLHGAKIKDFGRVVTGKTPPTKNQEYYGDKYPFITPTDISENSIFVNKPERYLSEQGAKKIESSKLPTNSVCYTCIASIGKIAITKEESFTNQQINSVIVNPKKADYRYVFFLLRNFTPQIKGMVGGAASPIINKSAFEDIDIDILDPQAQKNVADVLFAYDQLIENNTRRIKILEEIAQAIYKEWFVYFRFPGYEKVKLVDSKTEFGKIPEGWAVKELHEDFEVVLGGTPSRANSDYWNGDIPWINSSETNHLRVIAPSEFITKRGLDNSATKLMPKRTTVLAITGATLGQVSLLEIECSANQSVVGVYDKNAVYGEYLYLFISNRIDDIISKSGGSAQQHINKKIVEEYQVLVPPQKEVEEFNKAIKPIFDLLSDLLFSNQNLRQARDLLLPKLVNGEIRI